MRYVASLNINVPVMGEPMDGTFYKWTVSMHGGPGMVDTMRRKVLYDIPYLYLLSDQDVLNIFSLCHDAYGNHGATMEYACRMMRVVAIEMLPGGNSNDQQDDDFGF